MLVKSSSWVIIACCCSMLSLYSQRMQCLVVKCVITPWVNVLEKMTSLWIYFGGRGWLYWNLTWRGADFIGGQEGKSQKGCFSIECFRFRNNLFQMKIFLAGLNLQYSTKMVNPCLSESKLLKFFLGFCSNLVFRLFFKSIP